MADQRISDMTAATSVANADLIPIVQAGDNKKASKSVLFTGAAGEVTEFVAGAGGKIAIRDSPGTTYFDIDASGNIIIHSAGGLCSITYFPGSPTEYNGTPPTTIGEALDRINALLRTLNGGVGA